MTGGAASERPWHGGSGHRHARRLAAWSEAVGATHQQGRPVFVDFTAAWCVTCQVNERTTLSDATVLADFEARHVRLLRADWTPPRRRITKELTRLGRSGVPVYVLYPGLAETQYYCPRLLRVADVRESLSSLSVLFTPVAHHP